PNHPRYSMLTHIDAYRIESDDEMRVLGFKDIVEDASRLVAIEWPEKIATIMPAYALPVALTIVDGTTREITYDT
ncbi:MAG TPA: tRNA (adenosine(37)-N6)-threonylcarbamoyltransferase complex ATPase subunit type 1 TsaE, partial [Candidatus Paceibacterota bacterium]|nr:tRNA (adenosine(37)-N6)-threonylcarbamoyltransferase complex ATPase subunit type 1 TsaE [Candidatus Paceibacterota bacterium]